MVWKVTPLNTNLRYPVISCIHVKFRACTRIAGLSSCKRISWDPQRTALGTVSVTPKVTFWLCYSPAPPFSSSRKKKKKSHIAPHFFSHPNHCDSTCGNANKLHHDSGIQWARYKIGRGRSHQILSFRVRAVCARGNPASPNAVWASGVGSNSAVSWWLWLAVSLLFITLGAINHCR